MFPKSPSLAMECEAQLYDVELRIRALGYALLCRMHGPKRLPLFWFQLSDTSNRP